MRPRAGRLLVPIVSCSASSAALAADQWRPIQERRARWCSLAESLSLAARSYPSRPRQPRDL
eukprot:4696926-Pleurochrysis_carterae.AAC.1